MNKTRTLYHGTTYENYKSILQNGFNPRKDSAWRVSNQNYMFFYDETRKSKEECFNECIGNILYTAIFNNFQGTEFVILELNVPEKLCISDDPTVDKDWNDENQKSTVVKVENLNLSMIRHTYINHFAYNKYLRWWYFANIHENGCSQSVNKELWDAVIIMTETGNWEEKQKLLNETMFNQKNYIKIK